MGAVNTKSNKEALTSKDMVLQFIADLSQRNYPDDELAQLMRFCEQLRNLSSEECSDLMVYCKKLILKTDNFRLLKGLILIANKVGLIWQLDDDTLDFFIQTNEKNKEVFNDLLSQLKALCDNKLYLKAHHLNALIYSLKQQMNLPIDVLNSLDVFLNNNSVDYDATLQGLRSTHGPELDNTAQQALRLHHAAPHALEVSVRSMYVLQHLGLFTVHAARANFLKAVIRFIIEFHDYEQMPSRGFVSAEEATGNTLFIWLTTALKIEKNSSMDAFMAFIINRIIVLGTTMVFSPVRTMDLSELYFLIESAAKRIDFELAHSSNLLIIQSIEAVMLVAGLCDKNPASVPLIAEQQEKDKQLATLNLLENYQKNKVLVAFFNKGCFKPYFNNNNTPAIDIQTFFITLAPHVGMRTELSAHRNPELSRALIQFIAEGRVKRLTLSKEQFIEWYDEEFSKQKLVKVLHELLFLSINNEIAFNHSQLGGLTFVSSRLLQNKLINAADLIDANVPARDAANLEALNEFNKKLDTRQQEALASELVMAVLLQVGAIYIHQQEFGYKSDVANKLGTSTAVNLGLFSSPTSRPVENTQKSVECNSP